MSAGVKILSSTPPTPRRAMMVANMRTRSSSHGARGAHGAAYCGKDETVLALGMDRYVFNEARDVVGSGAFGDVFKARDISKGATVAVKRAKKNCELPSHRGTTHAGREIAAMMHLQHDGIVRMIDSYMDGSLHIVYEFAEYGDLLEWTLRKYEPITRTRRPIVSSRTLTRISRQTGQALAYCHKLQVAQRDFKLDNVIVVRDEPNIVVKIVDFGLSFGACYSESSAKVTSELVGTLEYAAPEVLLGRTPLDPYKADVWSYGIALYVIAHADYPVDPSRARMTYTRKCNLSKKIEYHVRDGMRNVIARALEFAPDDRPTMEFLADDARICESEAQDTFAILPMTESDSSASSDGELPSFPESGELSPLPSLPEESSSSSGSFDSADSFSTLSFSDEA